MVWLAFKIWFTCSYCLHQFHSFLITLPLKDSFFIWLSSGKNSILIFTTFLPCVFCILSLKVILQTLIWKLWEKAEYDKCLIFSTLLAKFCHSVIVLKYWTILRIPTWNISIKLITCFVNLQTTTVLLPTKLFKGLQYFCKSARKQVLYILKHRREIQILIFNFMMHILC